MRHNAYVSTLCRSFYVQEFAGLATRDDPNDEINRNPKSCMILV